jgi:choline dehydrogenase-like flavoprotein
LPRGNDSRYGSFEIELQVEQAPRRDNFVRLAHERDAFGRQLPHLRWQWSDLDIRSARITAGLLRDACLATGVGTLATNLSEGVLDLTTPGGSSHPTGATRAHANATHGVVDADLRVHGVRNLFVVGSSVFPTSGYANPTFTILALGLRLAEHLRRTLGLDAP